MGKRTRIDIIADMLGSIQNKNGTIKPTHLMYKSNLSHSQMQGYLEDLISNDLIKKEKVKNYDYIILTDKGYEFIRRFREMKEFEKSFGL